jgi:hypothetical protein
MSNATGSPAAIAISSETPSARMRADHTITAKSAREHGQPEHSGPCSAYAWCTAAGEHTDHASAGHVILDDSNGDELVWANLLHLDGSRPSITFQSAGLTPAEARAKGAELVQMGRALYGFAEMAEGASGTVGAEADTEPVALLIADVVRASLAGLTTNPRDVAESLHTAIDDAQAEHLARPDVGGFPLDEARALEAFSTAMYATVRALALTKDVRHTARALRNMIAMCIDEAGA